MTDSRSSKCACVSQDARRFAEMRYNDQEGDPCECACHDDEDDRPMTDTEFGSVQRDEDASYRSMIERAIARAAEADDNDWIALHELRTEFEAFVEARASRSASSVEPDAMEPLRTFGQLTEADTASLPEWPKP